MHTKSSSKIKHAHDALSSSTTHGGSARDSKHLRKEAPSCYDTPHNLKVSRFLLTGSEYGEVASVVRQEDE